MLNFAGRSHCTGFIPFQWSMKGTPTICAVLLLQFKLHHDDVIKWKHFSRYWPSVRGIHRSPVNSPHKGQWRGAFIFSLICVWMNGWVNNRDAIDLRRYRAHYDVSVMIVHRSGFQQESHSVRVMWINWCLGRMLTSNSEAPVHTINPDTAI